MSDYFQRLVQQTAVPISGPSLSPPAVASTSIVGVDNMATAAGGDFLEVHEERVAPASTPDPAPPPALAAPAPLRPATAPDAAAHGRPAPSATGPATTRERPTTFVEQNVVTFAAPAKPGNEPPPASSAPPPAPAEPPAPARPPAAPPAARDLPADVLQAVMKWISAGPHAAAPAGLAEPDRQETSADEPRPAPDTPAPAPAARITEPPAIPERVIRLALPANPPASPPPVVLPARPVPASSLSAPDTPPEPAVNVSIGSIQVRVEAPPPAPARAARPLRPAESARPAAPAPRPGGLSRLRRHYIIPH